jgi:micrococcal nuclease
MTRTLCCAVVLYILFVAFVEADDFARVVKVKDGDTIVARLAKDGSTVTVRLLRVDTPDFRSRPGHPANPELAQKAKEATTFLVLGKIVRLEEDVEDADAYERLLRYVWVDGVMVNSELLKGGFGEIYRHKYIPNKNIKHEEEIADAERTAKFAGVGIWAPESSE